MAADAPDRFERFAQSSWAYALIALIALASALFGAGAVPVMDRDEARFAQATRQMLETNDYVRIRIQNEERSKKPAGIHWLQAASVRAFEPLTHRLNEIWPYRVPSALGVLIAALATLWAGKRLVGARAAFLGAALLASSLLLGFEGMTAKTDAALCGFTALTMAALAHLNLGTQRPRALALLFWAAMGMAILIKGPIAPMIAAVTIVPLGLWERRWRWLKPLAWWPGPLLMLAIVLPWMIAIYQATEGRFFAQAIGHDLGSKVSGGSEGHSGFPGYHTLLLPVLIFPAAFALAFAARLGWRALRGRRGEEALRGLRFLAAWILPSFIVFELTPTKLPHYPLPLYPALALLCGAGLIAAAENRWRIAKWIGVALTALAGAVLVAGFVSAAQFMDASAQGLAHALAVGAAALAGLAIAGAIFIRSPEARVALSAACALAFSFGLRQIALPQAHGVQITAQLVQALDHCGLANRPLWVVGYGETSIVFMTRTDTHIAEPGEAGGQAAAGDALVIERHDLAATESALAARRLRLVAAPGEVRGRNIGNGHRLAFAIGEVQEASRN
jgi:4-amino-4-deoxy-L-arabinose transferase-like glycosyltransferase